MMLNINSQCDAGLSSCSVVSYMADNDWCNAKFRHAGQRSPTNIVSGPSFCDLLMSPYDVGDNVLADAKSLSGDFLDEPKCHP